MARIELSILDLINSLREYYHILSSAIDEIKSGPIDTPKANSIYRDLHSIQTSTDNLLNAPQLLHELELAESQILYLEVGQRNDLYSLVFSRMYDVLLKLEDPKFKDNSQTVETAGGKYYLSDAIHDLRTKIGTFYHDIFVPSFEPFLKGIQIAEKSENNKLEQLMSSSGDIEDEPAPKTTTDTGITTLIQLVAWMDTIGLIDAVTNATKDNGTPNYHRAGKLISTFTSINPETARKAIEAIKKPGQSKKNPNPYDNTETQRIIQRLITEHKLNV